MDYIFGPVNSRRLGRSLGIDLFSEKTCNLNCIYCEVGRGLTLSSQRVEYTPTRAILTEIDQFCADPASLAQVDVVTVTAKGEPTLHLGLGKILQHLKQRTRKTVAVLTNGTTLDREDVRRDLMAADLVIPSLDSARKESFIRVDRPMAGIDPAGVIKGLTLFSLQYPGKIWLEILLAQGMNDTDQDVEALIAAIRPLRIDRIQLHTVLRPPAESSARPVDRERLQAIARLLAEQCALPVDLPFSETTLETPGETAAIVSPPDPARLSAVREEIMEMLRRRPCTAADIDRSFQLGGPEKVEQLLAPLVESGRLQRQGHGSLWFYHPPRTTPGRAAG